MHSKLRLALAGCSLFCLAGSSAALAQGMDDGKMDPKMMTVEVTITNMTTGQPFAPPIVASHSPDMHLFKMGETATPALEKLAETGMSDELVKMLEHKATDIKAGGMDNKIMPGKSATYKVKCKPGDVVSVAGMVAATNDGFFGVDGAKPDAAMKDDAMKAGEKGPADDAMMKDGKMTMMVKAMDAGTEENTEKKSDTAAPDMGKGHPATTPPQPISEHKGIMGTGDLDKAMFGWDGPVAKIEMHVVK